MAVTATEGAAGDRRVTCCSFQRGSLQQPKALLGRRYMVNTHIGMDTLINTALAPGAQFTCQLSRWFCSEITHLTSLQAHPKKARDMVGQELSMQ